MNFKTSYVDIKQKMIKAKCLSQKDFKTSYVDIKLYLNSLQSKNINLFQNIIC